MNANSSRVTLRQLCHLGLPAPLLLPSLLPVLRELVPASHAGFFFCDESGGIVNLYAERMLPPSAMAAYHDEHSDHQFRRQYLERVAAANPLQRRSVSADERMGGYYRDVLVALGIEHFLYCIVRHNGHVLGQLSLYRGVDECAFSHEDEQSMNSVLHYLGDGLSVPSPGVLHGLQDEAVEDGLALFDTQGREIYADANWPRLVRLAHGNAITPATALAERETLPRFVAAMLAVAMSTPHAIHTVRTGWGQFAFRKHAMTSACGAEAVAISVSRLAAEPLLLTKGAGAMDLSPQQREVAVLMAKGHSNTEIARHMGISTNTASYHAKQVFGRLNVHDRSAIARVLSTAAGAFSQT